MTLNNVELRTEVLQDELETPLTFKRIFIQELKLNIPWASLRYQPAKVSLQLTFFSRVCARCIYSSKLAALSDTRIAAAVVDRFECATLRLCLWPAAMSLLRPARRKKTRRQRPSRTTQLTRWTIRR